MSEALSSSEIEDVLSSIRRLVSDDIRPVPKGAAQVAVEGDKLLLTPALRVVQSDPAPQDTPAPAMDEVVLAVSAGVAKQPDEWESETGDLAPMADPFGSQADAGTAQDWQDHQIDAYVEVALDSTSAAFDSRDVFTEPDAFSEEDAFSGAGALAEPGTLADDQAETAQALRFGETQPLPGWAQSTSVEATDELHADPWVDGTIEPDRAWADQAEAAVLQELAAAGPIPQVGADEFVLNPTDDAELPVNEEMLREIVRDVLREELQGRLGERITRNIRKLVRAEIARVMATEEFL